MSNKKKATTNSGKSNSTKPQPKKENRVAFVIDESGSMRHIANEVIQMQNATMEPFMKAGDQNTEVTVISFSDGVKTILENESTTSLRKITNKDYHPEGSTALYDAVNIACKTLSTKNPNMSYVVYVLTDGEENASRTVRTAETFRKMIQDYQKTDHWTFAFLVPDTNVDSFRRLTGVPAGNIRAWDTNNVKEATTAVTQAMTGYLEQRRQGATNVKEFFVADIKNIKKVDFKAMDDITDSATVVLLDKEDTIKNFVENGTHKARRKYAKGCTYYLLQRKEEVQADKKLILVNKSDKKIYAGGVREKLKLPSGVPINLEPGNFGEFDIFVMSNSVNRILPRDSKVVIIKEGVDVT